MIGLPTETDDDLVAIRDLTLRIRDAWLPARGPGAGIGRISVSVNPLVPKPVTRVPVAADGGDRRHRAEAALAPQPCLPGSTTCS